MTARGSLLLLAGLAVLASPALCRLSSADELRGAEISISRASSPITVDGDLGDAGWIGATRVETFYETNPGDNVPPEVRTVARLAYDDRFPRDFRYQMFSAKLPRGRNCFICSETVLTGLSGLPPGGNVVAAPYVTASQETVPREDGSGLVGKPAELDGGLDVKWTPSAGVALDGTINPDFSQIESDVARIGVNERFALFYPEKRPFFLEGVDLLSSASSASTWRLAPTPSCTPRTSRRGRAPSRRRPSSPTG